MLKAKGYSLWLMPKGKTFNKLESLIFKQDNDSVYRPHLSLMYGNFAHKIKKQIINSMGENFIQ